MRTSEEKSGKEIKIMVKSLLCEVSELNHQS